MRVDLSLQSSHAIRSRDTVDADNLQNMGLFISEFIHRLIRFSVK